MSILLGVNIDHVATLRQARYAGMLNLPNAEPSPLEASLLVCQGGADSMTLHIREDRRHIQEADAFAIREKTGLPLNLEMANTPEMLALALRLRPDFSCLVPEKRQELTTEGGLDAAGQVLALRPAIAALQEAGIRVSLFVDPDPEQVQAAAEMKASIVELHTGAFANSQEGKREGELERLAFASTLGCRLGLQVNAGHGINYANAGELLSHVTGLTELNIGHSIISRALFVGLSQAVREMRDLMNQYAGFSITTLDSRENDG